MIRLSSTLLRGAALAAIVAATPAYAQEDTSVVGPIDGTEVPTQPLYGTINPFYGTISPFYGTINPFYGNIGAFWGTINPFYGNIGAFWGTINPFYGNIGAFDGTTPAYGDIGRYWEQFGAQWVGAEGLWTDPLQSVELSTRFATMLAEAEMLWGTSVAAATGKTFSEAFLNPLFARYGINPSDPATLQALSSVQRSQFFLDWYDGLMRYSGVDRVDHWMRTVNWTPAMTQQQGSGADSIIGLLDATASGDPDIADNIVYSGGYSTTVEGHGVGVASLMVAAHDRLGVMGIAPNARVIAFNPFDSTNTASWSAIREGILALAARNASVINMSLGVPGYTLHPDWRKIFFDGSVFEATRGRVFVMAAGNDGSSQTENLRWDWNRNPNLIIVGSVRVDGVISSFSNKPGTACLLNGEVCQQHLMDRFMVAPGELMLVPDGRGGFIRRSGTSFAAPLVSGAITLLHDRWPWLARYPGETVDIILRSARDLGDPGTDAVYGRGLLDVGASQSPLDFNKLQFYEVRNGTMTLRSAADVRAAGVQTTWEADGVYFHLYEPIGNTFRDFTVPVSSLLVGQVGTLTGANEYFQQFITSRMTDWIRAGSSGFSDIADVPMLATPALQVSVSGSTGGTAGAHLLGSFSEDAPHTAVRVTDAARGWGFAAGHGNGAFALNGQEGLGLSSDYSRQGGVNPVLALASGGPFAAVDLPISGATTLSLGYTRQHLAYSNAELRSDPSLAGYEGVEPFAADAVNLRVTHRASDALSVTGSYARVREANGLLGVQSRESTDLGHGAVSETATLGARLNVSGGVTLAASGTVGRTRSAGNPEQGFTTGDGGVLTSAFAVSATRQGLFGRRDALRMSLAQPLHIERGALRYGSVQVIDRQTGELGIVEQQFDVTDRPRAFSGELLYAAPILSGGGELGLFGRAELQAEDDARVNHFAAGARVNLRF